MRFSRNGTVTTASFAITRQASATPTRPRYSHR